jgi:hypothetical protein
MALIAVGKPAVVRGEPIEPMVASAATRPARLTYGGSTCALPSPPRSSSGDPVAKVSGAGALDDLG